MNVVKGHFFKLHIGFHWTAQRQQISGFVVAVVRPGYFSPQHSLLLFTCVTWAYDYLNSSCLKYVEFIRAVLLFQTC